MKTSWFWISVLLATALGLVGLASSKVTSFDIFWQLQSGRYMLETGSFIYQDTFSLADQVPRWEHCWLHDVIAYWVYRGGGYTGLSLLKGMLLGSTWLGLVFTARLRGSSWLTILAFGVPPVLLTEWAWLDRPQLWSFLMFSLFLLVLELYRRSRSRMVYLLLPLMLCWANLHGGALLALPVLFAYLAGEGLKEWMSRKTTEPRQYKRLLWAALGVLIAGTLTPYGIEIFQKLLLAARFESPENLVIQITNLDWRPLSFNAFPEYFYALFAAAAVMVIGWKRLSFTDVFLLSGLAIMGLRMERHSPFFLFAFAALLPVYGDCFQKFLTGSLSNSMRWFWPLCIASLAMCIVVPQVSSLYKDRGVFSTGLKEWRYPIGAAAFVRQHNLPGNLFNSYGWGGYLMWDLFPEYRVFWDGRSSSPQMYSLGSQVANASTSWEQILEHHSVNVIVTEPCSMVEGKLFPLVERLRSHPQWALVFADESSLVFVRSASVTPAWLERYRLPANRLEDTILSQARLVVADGPWRFPAYWEWARVCINRKLYAEALVPLRQYLLRAPSHQRVPQAETYYRMIHAMMGPEAANMQL